ncbi:MAG: hypothetical protein JWQ90_757 [Hydrocarboniphaga sp.]|nr:hypothetical protein [Hydrocarboniphaga sp.]
MVAVLLFGLFSLAHSHTSSMPVQDSPGWFHASVVDSDSPRAKHYRDRKQELVHLPDSSPATLASSAGQPQALLLPPSNSLADHRERALQAGAALEPDSSVVLPAVTEQGKRVDFVIAADGRTLASAPRRPDAAQR